MGKYEEQKEMDAALTEIATKVASQLSDEMLVRIIKNRIEEALSKLNSAYGSEDIKKIVQMAIDEKVADLLKTTYADRVEKLARPLAEEALVIAKQKVSVIEKSKRY